MKKRLLMLSIACLVSSSCTDKDYDLSDLDTDNITIGDRTTMLEMPLATIEVRMDELSDDGIRISDLFEEVDIWLPSQLPADREGQNAGLNIAQLLDDDGYLDRLLAALFEQVRTDDVKLSSLTDLAWSKYRSEFLSPLSLTGAVTETAFKNAFRNGIRTTARVQATARDLATGYLRDLKVEPVNYLLDEIDLDSDVVDMLVDNLDPEGAVDSGNRLTLYGRADNSLPVRFLATPGFENTGVSFSAEIESAAPTQLPESRIYPDDLRRIVAGTRIDIPVTLLRYYPDRGFSSEQQIRFTLCLRKTGGLKIDL